MLYVSQVHWNPALCQHRRQPLGWCSPNNSVPLVTPHVAPHACLQGHSLSLAYGCDDQLAAVTAAVTTAVRSKLTAAVAVLPVRLA